MDSLAVASIVMARFRRYLLPLVIWLLVVLVCAKLLFTPVYISLIAGFANPGGPVYQDCPERGWPWIFQEATLFPEGYKWGLLLADVAVLGAAIVVSGVLLMGWWRRSGYRFRFSLRSCLLLMILPAVGMGWWMSHVRGWQQEQRRIKACEGIADFSRQYVGFEWLKRFCSEEQLEIFQRADELIVYELFRDGKVTPQEATEVLSIIPHLHYLKSITLEVGVVSTGQNGENVLIPIITPTSVPDASIFGRIEECAFNYRAFVDSFMTDDHDSNLLFAENFHECANDQTLKVLGVLGGLKSLDLRFCNITDSGLAHLTNCRALESLNLANTRITDAGLRHLPVNRLRELTLHRCAITDQGLKELANFHALESLNLSHTKISAEGLAHLEKLPKLKQLRIYSTAITDDAFSVLAKFPALEELDFFDCPNMTGRNINALIAIGSLYYVEFTDTPESVLARDELEKVLEERRNERGER